MEAKGGVQMKDYRAKSIIAAYSSITGNKSIPSIIDTLKKSYTFNEILGGGKRGNQL